MKQLALVIGIVGLIWGGVSFLLALVTGNNPGLFKGMALIFIFAVVLVIRKVFAR